MSKEHCSDLHLRSDPVQTKVCNWYDIIDWSKGDWSDANKMQQAWDNHPLFPVVLESNKADASVNSSFDSEEDDDTLNYTPLESDDNLSLFTHTTDFTTTCKVEAKQRNPSLQGDRDKDGDGPAIILNNLRREVAIGASILGMLKNNSENCNDTCLLDNDSCSVII